MPFGPGTYPAGDPRNNAPAPQPFGGGLAGVQNQLASQRAALGGGMAPDAPAPAPAGGFGGQEALISQLRAPAQPGAGFQQLPAATLSQAPAAGLRPMAAPMGAPAGLQRPMPLGLPGGNPKLGGKGGLAPKMPGGGKAGPAPGNFARR